MAKTAPSTHDGVVHEIVEVTSDRRGRHWRRIEHWEDPGFMNPLGTGDILRPPRQPVPTLHSSEVLHRTIDGEIIITRVSL